MTRSTLRRSRKMHHCSGCDHQIPKGARYLECVASPHHDDLGNTGWWRLAECEDCARRYGRGDRFDD